MLSVTIADELRFMKPRSWEDWQSSVTNFQDKKIYLQSLSAVVANPVRLVIQLQISYESRTLAIIGDHELLSGPLLRLSHILCQILNNLRFKAAALLNFAPKYNRNDDS